MELGKLLVRTMGITNAMAADGDFVTEIIRILCRFVNRDWGEICKDDKELNDSADERNDRIVARYKTSKGDVLIITEWDKSVTTILFSSEY